MSLDLSPYKAVQQATFVKMNITVAGSPVTVRMSTHDVPFSLTEFDNISYLYPAIGSLLNVSGIDADLKAKQNNVSITVSAIPNLFMDEIINNPIIGSTVEIRRAFFNATTGQFLSIPGNPVVEFSGIVDNYEYLLDDGTSENGGIASTTTAYLSCSSIMELLSNKRSGRRTSHTDQEYWFPGDKSMDRVAVVALEDFYLGGTTPSTVVAGTAGRTVTNTVNT